MKIAILTTDNREHFKQYALPEPVFGTAPEALLQGFALLPDIEVHVVACVREPVRSPEAIAPNIFYHSLLVPRIGWLSTGYQGCIRAVRKKLREIEPDIVHGQGTERDCAISAVFSGFPNVLTIHGNMAKLADLFGARPLNYLWLVSRLETVALRRTLGVLCNSDYTESLVKQRTRQVWRVDNPIRETFFDNPVLSREKKARVSILNVGVICARKQQVEILELAAALHREGCPVEFLFVGSLLGETPYGKAFLADIKVAQEAGYGSYVGTKNTEELIALFDSCDAMLHFPLEEAFGLVVAEGLARNLKFFGAAEGGVVDIATGVEGAELYAPGDWAGLKGGIAKWVKSGAQKPLNAGEGATRFHPRHIAEQHLAIYREVLEKRD